MKNTYIFFSLMAISCLSFGQNVPVDFETGGFGATWTWTCFENTATPPPLQIVANPDPSGINTSATVAKFIALQGGNPWAGCETMHGADIGTFDIDTSNNIIRIMVWKTKISDVGIKLVTSSAASLGEIKVANTVTHQWEQLTFDFSAHIGGMTYDQLVVFPDFIARPADDTIYFDNIFGAEVTCAAPSVQSGVTNLLCNGATNGAIDLTITNGTAPYSFVWDNAATTEDISGLAAGTYVVTVTDANTCFQTETVVVNEPTPLAISATSVDESGGAANGSIDLTVTDGTAPYSFVWDNAATTEDISGLAAGTYVVTVTDKHACTDTFSITISSVVNVNDIASLNDAIALYPNPTSGNVSLALSLQNSSDLILSIVNVTGQTIHEINDNNVLNKQYEIDLNAYPAGIYFIRIHANNQTIVRKLIIE